jgi:prepilin peptidase CpaA
MLWVSLALLIVATAFDLRNREIPDWISLALLAFAVGTAVLGTAPHRWGSLVLGFGVGSLLGIVLFCLGAFGGGDAKLLVGLATLLGPGDFAAFLFYLAVAGGILAVVALVRGRRDIAYAPAMALGFFAFMFVRGIQ